MGRKFFQFQPKSFLCPLKSLSRWRDENFTSAYKNHRKKNVYFIFPSSSFASRIFPTQSKVLEDYQFCFSTARSSVYVVFFPALRGEWNSNETREIFTQIEAGGNSQQTFFFVTVVENCFEITKARTLQSFHVPELFFSRPVDFLFSSDENPAQRVFFSLFTPPRSESVNEMMVESCTMDNTEKKFNCRVLLFLFCLFWHTALAVARKNELLEHTKNKSSEKKCWTAKL